MHSHSIIRFRYKNWRGEEEIRRVQPHYIGFGDTGPFHNHEYAWYLAGLCCQRNADRIFLASEIAELVWEQEGETDARLVRELINLIRKAP